MATTVPVSGHLAQGHHPAHKMPSSAYNPDSDATALHQAAKGSRMSTDNKTLIAIVCGRTPQELQEVRESYRRQFGHELVDDVADETHGDLERLLTSLLLPRAEFEAKCIHKAITGLTTDSQTLIDILPQRDPAETDEIKAAYLRLYNKNLEDDLQVQLKGSEERFFTSLVANKSLYYAPAPLDDRSIDEAVRQLYNAGQGRLGTDETTFINVLTRGGTDFLQKLNYRYAQLHGDSLVTAADKELGGLFARALKALLTPHDEFYADVLYKSMSGVMTDDSRLINTIVGRRHCLSGINWVFVHKFGSSLRARVAKEASGKYKTAMCDILENV